MRKVCCLSSLFLRIVDPRREEAFFKRSITSGCEHRFKNSNIRLSFPHYFTIIIPYADAQSPHFWVIALLMAEL